MTGARQSKFLLWKVNKPFLWEHVLDEMYHAALNLSLRLAYEQERDEEVSKHMDIKVFRLTFLQKILCFFLFAILKVIMFPPNSGFLFVSCLAILEN